MFTEFEDFEPLERNITISNGTDLFPLNITIFADEDLEDNELIHITIDPPELPTSHTACSTEVIIRDDDGKLLLIHV